MKTYKSFSTEDTLKVAAELAASAKPGDVICLSGPLGAGKTVFAQGFARGIGYTGRVTSPTFTIVQVYEGGRLPLYHFDLYRLDGGAEELEGIGYEEYFYSGGVCLVEWPEKAADAIPATALHVEMSTNFDLDAQYRDIVVRYA